MDRLAVLIDGEFMKKTLAARLRRVPRAEEIMAEVERITEALGSPPLYRVFYYTANPLAGKVTNPLDRSELDFARTDSFKKNRHLITSLEKMPDVAVRRGELVARGWVLKAGVHERITKGGAPNIRAGDLTPQIRQKGVDMRIGLDIASLALKRLVTQIAVVTGDSDMIPAFKRARREGLRVYLDKLGTRGREALLVHADRVIS